MPYFKPLEARALLRKKNHIHLMKTISTAKGVIVTGSLPVKDTILLIEAHLFPFCCITLHCIETDNVMITD